jgi:stress-induced morphogen
MSQSSGISSKSLSEAIYARLAAKHVEIKDMSGGCGQAFLTTVVSPIFADPRTLQRHKLVNTELKTEIAAIHSWTLKCYTPDEWEKLSGPVTTAPAVKETVEGNLLEEAVTKEATDTQSVE